MMHTHTAVGVKRALAVSCWCVWDFRRLSLSRETLAGDLFPTKEALNQVNVLYGTTCLTVTVCGVIVQQTCRKLVCSLLNPILRLGSGPVTHHRDGNILQVLLKWPGVYEMYCIITGLESLGTAVEK